ncbi:MAG: hypothetical protein IJ901_07855 [Bacteroidaceae bacterium]|nr:hypothetical protein [Bacteroidaceae bacterium]
MKEETFDKLRQQDTNLPPAIRLIEQELPPMPADLNARLMQRVERENLLPSPPHRGGVRGGLLMVAACVAGIMFFFLTPTKDTPPRRQKVIVKVERKTIVEPQQETLQPTTLAKAETKTARKRKATQPHNHTTTQLPPAEEPEPAPAPPVQEAVEVTQASHPQPIPETLTESDIPITRPENYKYTPEEIALMKKQANEAYLKWVELELEISKYTLEKMVQK